jgi:hypothetical protein
MGQICLSLFSKVPGTLQNVDEITVGLKHDSTSREKSNKELLETSGVEFSKKS